MSKSALAILICLLAAALPLQTLCAQSDEDPVIILNATQEGRSSYNYKESVTIVYRLCTAWEGPAGGTAAKALYQMRRSVKGLKPGEMLQFYPSIFSGSCSDNSGCQAEMSSIGDGFYRTVARNKDETKTFDRNRTSSGLPPSTFCSAFILRTADGAILHIKGLPQVSDLDLGYFHGVSDSTARMTEEQRDNFLTWKLSEAELDNWKNLNRSQGGGAPGPGKGDHWGYTAVVTARVPDLGEVAVEIEQYDQWIPKGSLTDDAKPGDEIVVKAWICRAGDPKTRLNETAEFTFELEEYGTETGVCCNWPVSPGESAGRPDLAVTRERNPALEQIGTAGPAFEVKAKTRGRVKEAKAIISSFDFGAWAILKVTVKDKKGNPLKVTFLQRPDKSEIAIPRDTDLNHIADAWQEANDAGGLPAGWDDAYVPGQDARGDGFPLYEKYRGFVVQTAGGRDHVRLRPREKAHFVIDPDNVFDGERWWEATGVRAYKVLREWTRDRNVDPYRGFSAGRGRWATRLWINPESPDDFPADERSAMGARWGSSSGDSTKSVWSPRDVSDCVMYPGHALWELKKYRGTMLRWLTAPRDDSDRRDAAWLLTLGIPRNQLVDRLKNLSDSYLQGLAAEILIVTALHETAHACGVNGHLDEKGDESPTTASRVTSCPMQYLTWQEKCTLVLSGELGRQGTFCDAEPYLCRRQLNVKD